MFLFIYEDADDENRLGLNTSIQYMYANISVILTFWYLVMLKGQIPR